MASNCTEPLVRLTYDPLVIQDVVDFVKSPQSGAIVIFAGTTRDSFEDKCVTRLEYEAYEPMALKTLNTIARKAQSLFPINSIAIIHRLGIVGIGEESVLIAVSCVHRKAAWEAGEWLLEEIKEKAEIWKKEVYLDGSKWKSNK